MTQCASCSMPIPEVVANAPFCPYCGVGKETARTHAAEVAKIKAQRAASRQKESEAIFSRSPRDLTLAFDARIGFALLGTAKSDGEPQRLRAYDVYNKRVAWEALSGVPGIEDACREALTVHAGNVYVGAARTLYTLDLYTGAEKWRAELSDKLKSVVDPTPPGARGPLWAVAVDDVITALDRDTGQPLWRETRENMPRHILPFESGMLLLQSGQTVELVDPITKKVVDSISGRVERLDLDGPRALLQVERWGWRERDGLLVHDFLAKKELMFEAVEDLEDDVPTVAGHGRLFAAVESGAKLVAAPKAKPVELVPGFHIRTLTMCGPTLMVLMQKHHGTSVRRLVGVDPQTLAIRFDSGELGTRPSDSWIGQMCSDGAVAVLITSHADGGNGDDLVALDPAGRTVWKVPVEGWRGHWFYGGHLVVATSNGWQFVRPDNGEIVAAFTK